MHTTKQKILLKNILLFSIQISLTKAWRLTINCVYIRHDLVKVCLFSNLQIFMLLPIYANILLFYTYIVICLKKSKKNYFFYTLYFIFKILTYKKNSKPIGENSSLVTFFLTTRYDISNSIC